MKLTRRSFLKGSAAMAAGTAAAGLMTNIPVLAEEEAPAKKWNEMPDPIPADQIIETVDCDVLVVGLGYSGTCAVRAAAEAGPDLKVVGIEHQDKEINAHNGHDFGHINSKALEAYGVDKVDPIDFLNNWQVMSGNKSNPALVRQFAFESGEALDWFFEPVPEEDLALGRVAFYPETPDTIHDVNTGIKNYTGCIQFNGVREDGSHLDGQDLIWANQDYITENCPNAELRFSTSAAQILMDGEAVVGIIAENEDGYVQFNAKKIILATGGFGANAEMCKDLLPDVNYMVDENDKEVISLRDNDGMGIRMGVWAGGRLESGPIPTMGWDTVQSPKAIITLWLDENGERFSNEAFAGPEFTGFLIARLIRRKLVCVFDSDIDTMLRVNLPGHRSFEPLEKNITSFKEICDQAYAAGSEGASDGRGNMIYAADDLETLADYVGYDEKQKAQFLASVSRYNEMCKAGRDEDFGKDPHFLHPIVEGPFYAAVEVPRTGSDLVTVGGLLTTKYQQVLNMSRLPIEGLYATGNCCGMRFGTDYITPIPGVSIGMAITLGRAVGRHCAEEMA